MNISEINKNYKLNFIFIALSVSLWLYSLVQASQNFTRVGLGDLGLITIMPFSFFIATSLLSISFFISLVSAKKNEKLLFMHIVILIVFLFASATLIEALMLSASRMRHSYMTYGFIDPLIRSGSINPSAVWYHNWPIFVIFMASSIIIPRIDPPMLINTFPFISNLFFIFPLYILFRSLSNSIEKIWISMWFFLIANWAGQDYFSPQCFAYYLFLICLFLLFKYILRIKDNNYDINPKYLSILIIIQLALTMGHMLTAIIMISILLIAYLFRLHNRIILISLFSIALLFWTVYGAMSYFDGLLAHFISQTLNFDLIFSMNIGSRVAGSPGHLIVTKSMISFSAIIGIMAFLGYILSYRHNDNFKINNYVVLVLIGIFIISIIIPYGGEIVLRAFIFCLPLLAYMASHTILSKNLFHIVIIFLILIAPPLNLISSYGTEYFHYISPGEIKGSNFLYENTNKGYIYGGYPWCIYKKSYDTYKARFYWSMNNSFLHYNEVMMENISYSPQYLLITEGDRARYFLRDNASKEDFLLFQNKLDSNRYYKKLYTNSDFDIYSK